MKQESGRSMIEMLGVLAIMGVITVGAIGMIAMAMNTQKRTAVSDEVIQMVTQVRTLLSGYDDFSNIDNTTIFGAIGMKNQNPYGGTYELATDMSNPRQFIVTINGLPKSDCEYFMTMAWKGSVGNMTDGTSGASGICNNPDGKNTIKITYGE